VSPWGGAIYDPRNFTLAEMNLLVPRILHANLKCIRLVVHEKKILKVFAI